MNGPAHLGDVSYCYDDIGGLPAGRPPLSGDTTPDVCIIGAGYTGLWTAWYLRKADPSLRIAIVRRNSRGSTPRDGTAAG